MPELIHEHSAHIRTPEGLAYLVRIYGARQSDGTWIGWLEFDPVARKGPVLRTDRETSQATRSALESWALGLEMAYFEGAFARARVVG
jgi:hypothetical protein